MGYFSQDLSYLYMHLYIVHTKALLLPVALTYSHIDTYSTVLSHIIAPSDETIMSFRWESIGTFCPTEVIKVSERALLTLCWILCLMLQCMLC